MWTSDCANPHESGRVRPIADARLIEMEWLSLELCSDHEEKGASVLI